MTNMDRLNRSVCEDRVERGTHDHSPRDYKVRVRGTAYLWGSAGLVTDLTFDKPLVFILRNDPFGEAITLGTELASGAQTVIGTLDPGQCVSIPVQSIRGVFASCALESTVHCLIKAP